MTTTTATAAPSPTTATGTAAPKTTIAGDFNTFLTLLTAQLKNQDPTKAMDVTEMTNQLVSFSQVEQQMAMNSNLNRLIALQQASQLTTAAPLMGQTLEVAADRLTLQDGLASLRLPAAGAAQDAVVRVRDGTGRLLREAVVALRPGQTTWSWDGKDSAGRTLPDGAYAFTVSGRDALGKPQAVEATVLGRATQAQRQADGDLRLGLGGLSVGFDAVRSLGVR